MKFNRKENKLFNLRPFTFAATAMIAGVGFSYAAIYCGVPIYFGFLTLLVPLATLFLDGNKRIGTLCLFLYLTFLCVGMGLFALQIQSFETKRLSEGTYVLQGEVTVCESGTDRAVIDLKNVTFDGANGDGSVRLYVYGENVHVSAGSRISLSAKLMPVEKAYSFHRLRTEYLAKNIKYTAIASEGPEIVGYRFDLFPFLNEKVRSTLYENMSDREASLAFALTTGETAGIEEGLISSIRYGGVAHLFAVSGMHIGIVFSGLVAICKKLRFPRWMRAALPIVVGFLFCGICNFTPSSLRAYIILSVSAVINHFFVAAEKLETISVAALVLLCLSPANLFSAGFVLSFTAYLGISVVAPVFHNRLLSFFPSIVKHNKVCTFMRSINGILCVQITLLPVQLAFFGYVSVWGLLLNFLILPAFSLLFPVLLLCVCAACLFPLWSKSLLFVPANIVKAFAALFSVTDYSTLLIGGIALSAAAVTAYYLWLFLSAGLVRGNHAPLCAFLVAIVIAEAAASHHLCFDDCRITQLSGYGGELAAMVQTPEGNVLLVNDSLSPSTLSSFVHHRAGAIKGVVVVADNPAFVIGGLLSYGFEDFYILDGETGLRDVRVHTGREFTLCGTNFQFFDQNCVRISYAGVTGSFYAGDRYTTDADFALFSAEERDELIFCIKSGILSIDRA